MLADFLRVIPNKETRKVYAWGLKGFVGDADDLIRLARRDKEAAERFLLDRVVERREKVASSTVANNVSVVKSLLEFEDIALNWKRVGRAVPSVRHFGADRAPTIEEIRRLLEVCGRRDRAAVLLMLSSGIRVGSFDYLSVGDFTRLESGIGKLVVYRGEPEEYLTFCTPEAAFALEAYLDERRKAGEDLTAKSPILRESLDMLNSSPKRPKRIGGGSLKRNIQNCWIRSGVKEKSEGRGEFKGLHGFRKYFKTRCERSLKTLYVEVLLGHRTGLHDSYYKPREDELAEEYIKAIPDLTISETEDLRKENAQLQQQIKALIEKFETRLDRIELERRKEQTLST